MDTTDIMPLAWFVLLLFIDSSVRAHPQCLNFRPPFTPESPLQFCTEYANLGCCTRERDEQIMQRYQRIQSQFGFSCSGEIKAVLCQECSPYAAHLFDSEATGREKPMPGMCSTYCQNFYTNCRDAVPFLTQDRNVLDSRSSMLAFCGQLRLPDPDYCYPELKTNRVLNDVITNNIATVDGCLCLEPFADRLRNPLVFRTPPDGSGRIFVAEQLGVIWIYFKNGTRLPEYFMDISGAVFSSSRRGDERGFLGLTFHPQFANNKKLFVYYSVSNPSRRQSIRISEFKVRSTDENKVDYQSEKIILEIEQPYGNHNGGEILFGVDGYLYLFVGDGGAGGDPQGYAQNRQSLLGKVLRIDVDNVPVNETYRLPPDNPFLNDVNTRPEIYALGIRNIWRCDVDDGDPNTGYGRGRIFCGDVGQSRREEIDIIEKGGNYGWNAREGNICFRQATCGNIGPEVFPIHDYEHSVGKSVTGGHVYRGCHNPSLNGKYIFGDYVTGRVWHLTEDVVSKRWTDKEVSWCDTDVCFNGLTNRLDQHILSFGEDDDGEIYVLTTSNPSSTSAVGSVLKIVDPRVRGDPTACRSYVPETTTTTTPEPTTTPTTTERPVIGGGGASGWLLHAPVLCRNLIRNQHAAATRTLPFFYTYLCGSPRHDGFRYSFNAGQVVSRIRQDQTSASRSSRFPVFNRHP